MNILFVSRDLQRLCNQQTAMTDRWGATGAAAVGQRLQELDAADRLGDLRLLPHIRLLVDGDGEEVIVGARDDFQIRLAPQCGNPGAHSGAPWHEARAVVVLDIMVETR